MRMSRKAGLLVSAAVCGALAWGAAGSALASIEHSPAPSRGAAPHKAPLPNTGELKAQAKSLAEISGVLGPVTDLINDVLTTADNGKLPADRITEHSKAVRNAISAVRQAGPEAPSAPSISQPDNGSRLVTGKSADDLRAAALTGLQTKTDALLKAIAADGPAAITSSVTQSVTALANVILSITLGGLPAPDLPGLPAIPRLPGGIA
ncbi:hypothetical protein [Streptomyces natalensis]|uniref:hypothetical protein n=1 Tax=Streptomyces natalensis TaxID=68242 RepID=UPI00068C541D|nr:hypothetical protein [Streptomyces natalensis]